MFVASPVSNLVKGIWVGDRNLLSTLLAARTIGGPPELAREAPNVPEAPPETRGGLHTSGPVALREPRGVITIQPACFCGAGGLTA